MNVRKGASGFFALAFISTLLALPSSVLAQSLSNDSVASTPQTLSSEMDARVRPGAVKLPPTSACSNTYLNPDGTYTSVLSAQPLRVRSSDGSWRDLYDGMVPSTVSGYQVETSGRLTSRIGGSSPAALNTVSRNGRSLSFAFDALSLSPGVSQSPASVPGSLQSDGQTIAFPEAFPGTDLTLTGLPLGGLKESVTWKQRSALPWNGEIAYTLRLNGLDPRVMTDDSGSHIYLSESGTGNASPVMEITPPFATDAHGNRTNNCWFLLADDHRSLTLVVDPNWLEDPTRAFPITVDPSVTDTPDATYGMDTWVSPNSPNMNDGADHEMFIGDTGSSGDHEAAYLRFNLQDLPIGANLSTGVNSATLNLRTGVGPSGGLSTDVSLVGGPWDERTLTSANAPVMPSTFLSTVTLLQLQFNAIDVTSAIASLWSGAQPNFGFMLKRNASLSSGGIAIVSSNYSSASLRPYLVVNFTGTTPSATQNVTLAGAARPWEHSTPLNPHQATDLETGNVVTTLPITHWQGFGPAVDFTLSHSSRQDPGGVPSAFSPISPKWTHSYNSYVTPSSWTSPPAATVNWTGPDETQDTYTYSSGAYASPKGVYNTLVYNSGAGEYQLTTPDPLVYHYDATSGNNGRLTSISDPNSQSVTLTYSSSSPYRLTAITDANPTSGNRRSLALAYDGSSRLSTITDPLGRVWTLVYDATTGDLIQVKEPRRTDGTTDSLEYCYWLGYDSTTAGGTSYYGHLITGIGEPNDNPTSNSTPTFEYSTEYDRQGRGYGSMGRRGLSARGMFGNYLYYSDATNAPATTVSVDQTDLHHQDSYSSGLLQSEMLVEDPTVTWAGPTTTYNWDSSTNNLIGLRKPGNPSTVGGSAFWTEVYTYNTSGDLLTDTTYVLNSAMTSVAQTRYSDYAYAHGHDRVTEARVKYQDSPSTNYRVTDYYYDGDTTNTGTSGWMNPTETKSYSDAAPATTRTVQYTYYSTSTYPGKVEYRTDANGNQWDYAYDNWGNPTQVKNDATGRAVSYTYDATARLLQATKTDNLGNVFTNSYHTTGTNPDWRPTSTSVNTSGTPTNSFTWDPNGNPLTATNNISGGSSSQMVTKAYTDGNLVVPETQPDQTVNYMYDQMGRRTQMTYTVYVQSLSTPYSNQTRTQTIDYVYNGIGQMTSQVRYDGYDSSSQTFSYSYDTNGCSCAGGNLIEQDNPNNTKTLLTYDNLNEEVSREFERNVSGTWTDLAVFGSSRGVDGLTTQLTRTNSSTSTDNSTKNMTYDAWGEMSEEQDLDSGGSQSEKQDFTYDGNGNRFRRDDYDASNSYIGGEVEGSYSGGSWTYNGYDAGNQLTLVNHYTASSTTTPSYTDTFGSTDFDGNGNELRTGKASSGATNSTLAYYPDNRLSSDTTSGTAETSAYDGSGRLVTRNTGIDDWAFGYDGDQGITDSEYVTSASEWYTKAERTETPTVQLAAAYSSSAVTLQYNLYDRLGNVAEATDSTGAPLGAYTADLYGRTSGTGEHQWLGQEGYRYRSTSSVYQVGHRVYDPAQGRFLQQDPMSEGEGDYTYAANNPANSSDPTGQFTIGLGVIIIVVAIIVTAVIVAAQNSSCQGCQSHLPYGGDKNSPRGGPPPIPNANSNNPGQDPVSQGNTRRSSPIPYKNWTD